MAVVSVSMAAIGTAVEGGRETGAVVVVGKLAVAVIAVAAEVGAPGIELDITETRLLEPLALRRK